MANANSVLLVLAALVTGALVPFQLAFNAQLGVAAKSPYVAGSIVFAIGAAGLAAPVVILRQPLPTIGELAEALPTVWLGGAIAVLYILDVVIVTPKLGLGSTAVLIRTH